MPVSGGCAATAPAARITRPPMRVADQGHPGDRDRPGVGDPLHQRGERHAVLAHPEAAVGPEHQRGPAALGQRLGVRRADLLAVPSPVALVLAEAVQEHDQRAGRVREGGGEGGRVRLDVAVVDPDGHRDGHVRALAQQPVADQAVDGGADEPSARAVLEQGPDPGLRQLVEAERGGPQAGSETRRRRHRRCRGAPPRAARSRRRWPGARGRAPGRPRPGGCRARCARPPRRRPPRAARGRRAAGGRCWSSRSWVASSGEEAA